MCAGVIARGLLTVSILGAAEQPTSERILTLSQFILVGSATAHAAGSHSKNVEQSRGAAFSYVATAASAVTMERIMQKSWSPRTKYIVAISNIVAAAILTGYLRANVSRARSEIRMARGIP